MTTTPPVPDGATTLPELFFPQFADSGGYSTQFVLFGSAGQSISGNIRFFSQAGQPAELRLR